MRKKLIALFTAVMVLTGYSLPAFAEEMTGPDVSVITADSEEADTADTDAESPDESVTEETAFEEAASEEAAEAEDTETQEDIAEQTDTDITDSAEASDEEISDEVTEEASDESPEDTDSAQPEEEAETSETDTPEESAEVQETADESSEETADADAETSDIADAVAEDTEELLEEEQELLNSDGWYTWDTQNGILTLKGQIPDRPRNNTGSGTTSTIKLLTDIDVSEIKVIYASSGAKAPADAHSLFAGLENLTSADLGALDVSGTQEMYYMFRGCKNLTYLNVKGWNTPQLNDIYGMFQNCSKIESIDLSSFDVSNIRFNTASYTQYAFQNCNSLTSLTLPAGFKVTTDMQLRNLPADRSYLGWAAVTEEEIVSGTGEFAVIPASSGSRKYLYVKSFCTWDEENGVLTLQGQLPDTYFDENYTHKEYGLAQIAGIDPEAIKKIVITSGTKTGTSADQMCRDLTNLTEIQGLPLLDTSKAKTMVSMFNGCSSLTSLDLSGFNTENVADMSGMFMYCDKLTSLDLSVFYTVNVRKMERMFYHCTALTTIKVTDKWTAYYVVSSGNMFEYCTNLKGGAGTVYDKTKIDKTYAHIDGGTSNPGYLTMKLPEWVQSWDEANGVLTLQGQLPDKAAGLVKLTGIDPKEIKKIVITSGTKTGTSAENMFCNLTNLTEIQGLTNLDTSRTEKMGSMFYGCSSLTSLDLSGLNTANVTDMQFMFYNCKSLQSLDLSDFDTSKLITTAHMFEYCSNLTSIDLSSFDTSTVVMMSEMFNGCSSLKSLDLSSFDTSEVVFMAEMFAGCSSLTTITVSDKWSTDKVFFSVDMFNGCTKLKGGAGTVYDSTKIDKTYAHIDGGASNPGYLTQKVYIPAKPNFNVTAGNASVTVKWNAVSGATSYRVYRKTGTSVAFLKEVTTTSYTDSGLTNGTKYGYLVRAFAGTTGTDYTDADWKYATPVAALAKPTFTVTAGDKSVTVKWNAVSGATSYRIYRKTGTSVAFLKEVTTLTYTDSGLTNGTKYGYLVRAFKGTTGTNYTDADWKYATPVAALAKPAFTVTAGDKSVTVKWNAVSGATSYRVYRKTGTSVAFLKEVTTLTYTDSGLTNGTKYGYLVRAFKGTTGTNYTDADWKFATPAAAATLAKPNFTVTAATGSATVKWSAVSGATSYRVYRMDGTTVKFLKEVTTLTYTDTTVANGTKYGYLVRAFKGSTGSAYTNADFKYVTPLAKPTVTLTPGTKQVTIKWNKVAGAASYRVYRIDGSAITPLTNTTGTSYTATGLTTGTKYGFTVRAFNGNDASTYASTDVVYTTAK